MDTKEMIKHLERRDTQYGWTLSWKYARAIIKALKHYDTLKRTIRIHRKEEKEKKDYEEYCYRTRPTPKE